MKSKNNIKELLIKETVTEKLTAKAVGSGTLLVYATPAVAALMEKAACELAQTMLDDVFTTVGTEINLKHLSPTPVGGEVEALAVLVKNEGRVFEFEITASDKSGVIATATHTRVSVNSEKFQKKADEKFAE